MKRARSRMPGHPLTAAERAVSLARLDATLVKCAREVAEIAARGAHDEAERLIQRICFARAELDKLRRAAPDELCDDGHGALWNELDRAAGG